MTQEERMALEQEWQEIQERLKGEFINPKDMRRNDEITSLLMTDGESKDIKFNFVKGHGGNKGMNITKPYYHKGKVG